MDPASVVTGAAARHACSWARALECVYECLFLYFDGLAANAHGLCVLKVGMTNALPAGLAAPRGTSSSQALAQLGAGPSGNPSIEDYMGLVMSMDCCGGLEAAEMKE